MKANIRHNIYKHMKCPICNNQDIKLMNEYRNVIDEKTFKCLVCGYVMIFLDEKIEDRSKNVLE